MEKFKEYHQVIEIDSRHIALAKVTGYMPDLEKIHKTLSKVKLTSETPEEIRGQFNVARNMALYSYFLYSLAPEVQLKTYTIIEYALRLKAKNEGVKMNQNRPLMLRQLLEIAVDKDWIKDEGFRHIKNPSGSNDWCKSMIETISRLRNSQAHGTTLLVPDFYYHICVCADFINQLFNSNIK